MKHAIGYPTRKNDHLGWRDHRYCPGHANQRYSDLSSSARECDTRDIIYAADPVKISIQFGDASDCGKEIQKWIGLSYMTEGHVSLYV